MKKVSIVVLNYKTYEETIDCLDSLFKVAHPNVEIIVVDNASGNDSLGHIAAALDVRKKMCARIDSGNVDEAIKSDSSLILFQSPSNKGYSAGNNWGIKIALGRKTDYVMLLNNDTLVENDFLMPLVNFAEQEERIGAVGPKIIGMDGSVERCCARGRVGFWGYCAIWNTIRRLYLSPLEINFRNGYFYRDYAFDRPKKVDILCGACLMIKASVIEEIGMLDETTFLMLEELILAEKLRTHGYSSYTIPDSVVRHKGSGTIRRESSNFIKKVALQSRLYYMKEYRGWNAIQRFVLTASIPGVGLLSSMVKKVFR